MVVEDDERKNMLDEETGSNLFLVFWQIQPKYFGSMGSNYDITVEKYVVDLVVL